jgi:hypothetical protein
LRKEDVYAKHRLGTVVRRRPHQRRKRQARGSQVSNVDPGILWRVVDTSLDVDHGRFSLVEDESDGPDLEEEGPEEPAWVTSGPGWLALLSGGSGHTPAISLEAWSRTPPAEERAWRDQLELVVGFDGESLRLWGTASGPSAGPAFVLPFSDEGRYRVRVHRHSDTGDIETTVQDRVIELVDDDEHDDGVWGLEEWLFQFWPES